MNYYIKSNRTQKPLTVATDQRSTKSEDFNSCMICTKIFNNSNEQGLYRQFCSKCLGKQICKVCILEITSLPCPFCHTNNKLWRFYKRKAIIEEINRKVDQKKAFWTSLNISKKNIHLQYAIKCGIEQFIQQLDSIIQKMADDIKYLVKLDFDKEPQEIQEDVAKELEQINEMEERYDTMMVELKNEFHIDTSE